MTTRETLDTVLSTRADFMAARTLCDQTENMEYVRGVAEVLIDTTDVVDSGDKEALMGWLIYGAGPADPGQPGYPDDLLGQFVNYCQRLHDAGEEIELADLDGYFDALRPLMSRERGSIMDAYQSWSEHRSTIAEQEDGDGPPPAASDWHCSDDEAVHLLNGIATILQWTPKE